MLIAKALPQRYLFFHFQSNPLSAIKNQFKRKRLSTGPADSL